MSGLDTSDRLGPLRDDLYEALIDAHRGLSEAESAQQNARLVLILINQVADERTVREAIVAARDGLGGDGEAPQASR